MTRSTVSLTLAGAMLMHAALGQDRSAGEKDDPIALKLKKAKDAYEAGLTKIRVPILKELNKRKKAAQESGVVERLHVAQEAITSFEKTNKIPDRSQAKEFRREYPKLRDQLVSACEESVRAYTRAGNLTAAESVAKDLANFRRMAWDPRPSPAIDYDKVTVRSNNGLTLEHDRVNSFKKDVNARAKVTLDGGKTYIVNFDDQGPVLCTHPFAGEAPATIDFGDLTFDRIGTLRLLVRSYPRTDGGKVVVKVDGRIVGETKVGDVDGWQEIPVPFAKNRVEIEHHAVGWNMEFMFFRYEIMTQANSFRTPRNKKGGMKK